MSGRPDIKQALVKWNRFGHHKESILGKSFEDQGERLAIVNCPYCSASVALEYSEYMQLLRMNELVCNSCKDIYTLRPIASLRGDNTNDSDDEDDQSSGVSRPTDDPDPLGRRDWGKA